MARALYDSGSEMDSSIVFKMKTGYEIDAALEPDGWRGGHSSMYAHIEAS